MYFSDSLFFQNMSIHIKTIFLIVFIACFLPALNGTAQNNKDTINIGFLFQNKERSSAKNGAELAILEATKKGGAFEYKKLKLITYSVEGLWGTGSKQSVKLVFNDNVLAIVGSLDGRNAHLAEQVTAKTKVAFVSAHATDMTLSAAFVPWYFRCVPNDLQQAQVICNEIFAKRKLKNVALLGTESYDSKQAMAIFIKVAQSFAGTKTKQFVFTGSGETADKTVTGFNDSFFDAVVLFGTPEFAKNILSFVKKQNVEQPVFATQSLLDNQKPETQNWQNLNNVIIVSSCLGGSKKASGFQQKFQEKFGYRPGPVATYAFDATSLILETIRKSGADRNKIIDAIQKGSFNGVTGKFGFDKNGNRTDEPKLLMIKNGIPTALNDE